MYSFDPSLDFGYIASSGLPCPLFTTSAMASSNSKVNELTNRLTDPYTSRSDPDEDEELFAQLEAEIENDDNAALRERGIEELKQE